MTKAEKKRTAKFVASLASLRKQGVPFIAIGDIQPWEDNPRLNTKAIPKVVESMLKFGWTNPILVRAKDGFLEAGHTRLAAALHIGQTYGVNLAELPCVRVEHTERDAKLYALADNRLGEEANWDFQKLNDIFAEFETPELILAGWEDGALPDPPTPRGTERSTVEFTTMKHVCPRCRFAFD